MNPGVLVRVQGRCHVVEGRPAVGPEETLAATEGVASQGPVLTPHHGILLTCLEVGDSSSVITAHKQNGVFVTAHRRVKQRELREVPGMDTVAVVVEERCALEDQWPLDRLQEGALVVLVRDQILTENTGDVGVEPEAPCLVAFSQEAGQPHIVDKQRLEPSEGPTSET
jgi:hypothetical protein